MNQIGSFLRKHWKEVLVVVGIFGVTSIVWGWPAHYAPAIYGTVTDITTKEPVPDAIIECKWHDKVFAIFESVGGISGSGYYVSNSNGKYRIPGRFSLHVLSRYDGMIGRVRHPLYEGFNLTARESGGIWAYGCHQEKAGVKGFHCAVRITRLDDKYRGASGKTVSCDILDSINQSIPYLQGAALAGVNGERVVRENLTALVKLMESQPYHYCKSAGLETLKDLQRKVSQREVVNSGMGSGLDF